MVRRTPRKVINNVFTIPKELKENCERVVLHMDVFYINDICFLGTIGQPIYYRTCVPLPKQDVENLYKELDKTLRVYNRGGFKIIRIECDGEFKKIMDDVEDNLGVRMNYTNTRDHVSVAERNNRTIKEAFRTALHRSPYNRIPEVLIKQLAMICTNSLNWFPAKNGVSSNYSPMTIIEGKCLDYKKDCTYEFGTYVQAHSNNEETNDMTDRSIDTIYLRPNNNIQGSHRV